ncbi:GNAT family N-acetyltransferase [Micromonospora sp. D93]|uniref:GNAT family N-acetyltransferase n=1 Tax=Micromonospora sp. D93 TaxID=2824886 RepID=UPI001B361E95|nr:GNAT family N-acetyltransferase [Micromonospora sp. D93]MBQ1018619.1 GNAT family N-acetyltransferase [Micromonospora sp. D93]
MLQGEEIVLRDWLDADLPDMPFNADAFLVRIRRRRAQGIVDLAVMRDGGEPLGLVALHMTIGVLGHTIGPAHRGRGMASRSLRLMTRFCHEELGFSRLRLSIVPGNVPS